MDLEQLSLTSLFITLFILIILSAFFSGSETAMMAINRYRLRHLVRKKNRAALRVSRMLEKLERVLGVVLIGNTFANIFAGSVATIIGIRLWGDVGVAIGSILLTIFVLIFCEIMPKTIAAAYPERTSFLLATMLSITIKLLYPFVWLVNLLVKFLLKLLGMQLGKHHLEHLSLEEFSTLLQEAGAKIPKDYQGMLLGILSLEKATVEDVIVPRQDMVGINLNDDWDVILNKITRSSYTRLPVYYDDIQHICGILHLRDALDLLAKHSLDKESLKSLLRETYFIPEGVSLNQQLLNFRNAKQRMGIVVNEYGDVLGLVTLEDILEEVVGEYTTTLSGSMQPIEPAADGSYLVPGSSNLRDLNRLMDWNFKTDGPRTLSGLIIEQMESIPQPGVQVNVSGYPLEIVKVKGNKVEWVKILSTNRPVEEELSSEPHLPEGQP